ncbi:uncharacterized protein LOC120629635 [Pararge aegeria]|uniref:Vitelline membrane associated protein P30 n=1 Tax=Pararge aegeria TaxID=116150 RepID=S4PCL1_9NEOP|nr:uncharacterized protein LOC120629635 [Pararge aegeria]
MKVEKKLQVLIMYCYLCLYSTAGDPVYPPFEFRRDPREMGANKLSLPNSNFPPRAYHVPQQQIIHTGAMQSQPVPTAEKVETENSSFSFNGFLNAMNEFSGLNEGENQKSRAANQVDDVNKYKLPSPNGYPRQNFDSWTPTIHDSASIYTPPTLIQHQSTSKASPKFNLLEPVTTKMSSKMSGLMGLVLALLGSGSDNLLMKGFKEVLIDGIIRPLLVAKGGLKVLISKLSIPLFSLVLINLEVLITVWWLWDDCPQPQPMPYQPAYLQPVTDNYSYNSTYK